MNRLTDNRIVLVTRPTRLTELVIRFNTVSQARFYVEHQGADFSDYLREDETYHRALSEAQSALSQVGRVQVVDRGFLPNFVFAPDDTVVTLGQDGLVANTLKYLNGQPVVGVNPDPERWDGRLLNFRVSDLTKVMPEVVLRKRPTKSVTMAKAALNNGQTLYGVNDLFIGPKTHCSARYLIRSGEASETQSSSGVIISTGMGSTGWLKSLLTGAAAITQAAEGNRNSLNADRSSRRKEALTGHHVQRKNEPRHLGCYDSAVIRPFLRQTTHPFPVSIETTPRIAAEQPEKLEALRIGGVDRVSLGVQSFNAATLASVNRRRQIAQTDRAMASLRATGFARTNLDIIFALPGQSVEDWKQDLERIIALAPDSITTYDCLYRGHGRALTKRTPVLPPPETYGTMYEIAHSMLTAAGWHAPYGSVNFSRHPSETGTSAYFEGRLLDGKPYLGLGNYATSLMENRWSFNAHGVSDYLTRVNAKEDPTEFFYELPAAESQAKYALYSLNYGFVDEARFARRFGVRLEDRYAEELNHAVATGWLECRQGRWSVKQGQFGRMHSIRSLFYTEPARQWLMALR